MLIILWGLHVGLHENTGGVATLNEANECQGLGKNNVKPISTSEGCGDFFRPVQVSVCCGQQIQENIHGAVQQMLVQGENLRLLDS